MKRTLCTTLLAVLACPFAYESAQAQRTYQVNQAGTAPSIDGVIDPVWSSAPVAGDFKLLRTVDPGTPDAENSSVQLLWDSDALYLLFQSDYGGWNGPNGGINFGADNLNVLFDPNADGEPNDNSMGQDSYLLAFAQPNGDASAVTPFAEAHKNGNFGDQGGNWSKWSGVSIAQSNDGSGGLAEVAIPWSQFDAELGGGDDGLFHPMAPSAGDSWYFNLGRISSDGGNLLPIFNYHAGQFFAERPMGVIEFVPEPATAALLLCGLCGLSGMRRRRQG